ncbi:MAG TPA: nodulation protein NfeD [Bryobacteraceae bacterium]|jgi:membrane-bound serine protease (ClpP class)|nr:nodulation protein NfeD [Bryobacteraceae bacterium]
MSHAQPKVVAVDVDGIIHPVTVEILSRAMEQAQKEKADAVLIRLNTPGGLMDAMRQAIEKIVASPIPVITYVTPSGGRAASAGFFLLQAGDVAVMAPGTNTGAAHPVLMGGQMDPELKRKVENDASASLRSLTQKRGRNSELAEKAVLESKSFTEKEALDGHLIELIAAGEADLLARLDGREVTRFDGRKQKLRLAAAAVTTYAPNLRERIISAVADPNLALILLVLGALGIYAEFSSPGLIAPGVAGAISVLLGLSALSVLPISLTGAALLVLAFTLFVLEAKFTSHGILGAGGAVAMVLGAVLLVDSPLPELRIRLSVAIALAVPFAIITTVLLTLVMRARANKVVTGPDGMLGEPGVAVTRLAPEGKVQVRGEYWNAVVPGGTVVAPGDKVHVVGIQGLQLAVKPDPKGE